MATSASKMPSTTELWAQDPVVYIQSEARKMRKLEKKRLHEGYMAGAADGVAVRDFAVFKQVVKEEEIKWEMVVEGHSESKWSSESRMCMSLMIHRMSDEP